MEADIPSIDISDIVGTLIALGAVLFALYNFVSDFIIKKNSKTSLSKTASEEVIDTILANDDYPHSKRRRAKKHAAPPHFPEDNFQPTLHEHSLPDQPPLQLHLLKPHHNPLLRFDNLPPLRRYVLFHEVLSRSKGLRSSLWEV